MDLETENRIAAILMKEAAELRRQAEKEGVHVYLQQPKPRVRPNPRFLAATVLGVQQANRVVEVNEMWKIREKEKELDDRLNRKSSYRRSHGGSYREGSSASESRPRAGDNICTNTSSSSSRGGGLRDEELEAFLHSKVKRGRGSVGSRMDETGPYLPSSESNEDSRIAISEIPQRRVVHGPEKPLSLKPCESSEEESGDDDDDDDRRAKKRKRSRSKKQDSEKHRSKSRSKDKKRRKEERRSKHKR